MKNKKLLIFLIIALVIIILIPVAVIANKKIFNSPIGVKVVDYEEQRKENEERAEKAKQERIAELMANMNVSESNYSISANSTNNEDDEVINKLKESQKESEEKMNKILEIMNRYYEEKCTNILNLMQENSDKMSGNELYQQPYAKELFKLIIDVIKNKDISENEKNLLKEFLQSQYTSYKNDSEMKAKFDEVLA